MVKLLLLDVSAELQQPWLQADLSVSINIGGLINAIVNSFNTNNSSSM